MTSVQFSPKQFLSKRKEQIPDPIQSGTGNCKFLIKEKSAISKIMRADSWRFQKTSSIHEKLCSQQCE